jgi:hypothetical protein
VNVGLAGCAVLGCNALVVLPGRGWVSRGGGVYRRAVEQWQCAALCVCFRGREHHSQLLLSALIQVVCLCLMAPPLLCTAHKAAHLLGPWAA